MDTLAQFLKEHYDNHPGMEIRDAVKFLYQSHMGPGHLIRDEEAAFLRLNEEWDATAPDPEASAATALGNQLCRLHISKCKAIGLSAKTFFRLFILTAQTITPDPAALQAHLDLVCSLPFPSHEVRPFLAQYRADGCPMTRHSQHYRTLYSPAYRIVREHYVNLLPVLAAIDCGMAAEPRLRVAIDGPCASGKSTLGRMLADIYRAPLIHMDDFFLRPEQRTPERLAQPGGNVDYERFEAEVLAPLAKGEPAVYRPWQCRSSRFAPEVTVTPGQLTLVEGSYALRPGLREHYRLKIWVEAPWEVRRQRLLDRDGPELLERFETLWIPMEERYFQAFQVAQNCGIRLCL